MTAERSFLHIDCAGLPPSALDVLLFGEPGLAHPERVGSVLLRDPASMPRDLQARLADWLHGDRADGPRVMATCMRELREEVGAGRLLNELRLALEVQTIRPLSLRDRLTDLPRLAAGMIERFGGAERGATPEALDILAGHSWPGNLRELEQVLHAAVLVAPEGLIQPAHLPHFGRGSGPPAATAAAIFPLKQTLRDMQRRLILFALRKARGHKVEAARLLDISRSELWRRMGELGVSEDEWRGVASRETSSDATPEDRGP